MCVRGNVRGPIQCGGEERMYVNVLCRVCGSFPILGGKTHVCVRGSVRRSSRCWGGGEDPGVCTWKRSRNPPMWGMRTFVCVRGSVCGTLRRGGGGRKCIYVERSRHPTRRRREDVCVRPWKRPRSSRGGRLGVVAPADPPDVEGERPT